MKIARWGNSLAVRLPAAEVARLNLSAGDDVRLTIEPLSRDHEIEERRKAIEKLRKLRGLLPADFKFDREEANARR
jgi:antitoxin MazE